MKKTIFAGFLAFSMLLIPQWASANPTYGQQEPWNLQTVVSGNSIKLTWEAPLLINSSDNGYAVYIHKDTPVLWDEIYSQKIKPVFVPFGTTEYTFADLSEGKYFMVAGIGLCEPQEGDACRWMSFGHWSDSLGGSDAQFNATVTASAPSVKTEPAKATGDLKPDLRISVSKALSSKRMVKGVSKKQYKIGVTISNKGKGDAAGDLYFSYNGGAPVLSAKGGLKAGRSKKVFIYVDMAEKGKSYVFTADPENKVAESNEANNTATRVVGK
jgi:hypothetical protein